MHFALTEDQQEMAGLTREVLADQCPPTLLHSLYAQDAAPDSQGGNAASGNAPAGKDAAGNGAAGNDQNATLTTLWNQLSEIGLPGLLVAEDEGGLGLDEVFLVAVAEEFGRACLPLPMSDSIAAAPAMKVAGDEVPATAWASLNGLLPWPGLVTRAVLDGHRHETSALTLEPADSIDKTRPLARCRAAGGGQPLDAAGLAEARARLACAAELVGLGAAMVDLTVGYVSQREQFGVPIGSFQAVKHHLADSRIAVDFARPAVAEAAWLLARRGPEDAEARAIAAQAMLRAGEAARTAARWAIQCHGGMGYTTEYDLHLFTKRAWGLSVVHGTADDSRRRIATHLGLLGDTFDTTPTLERNSA